MLNEKQSPDFPEYNDKTAPVRDALAGWWDDKIGDGNAVQDLLEPITESMLELKPGARVLDIACGAGRFPRRIAAAGANVVAIDHSERFIRRALQRSEGRNHKIDYKVMSAVDKTALLSLGEGRFDAAVSTMALMDMASIEPPGTGSFWTGWRSRPCRRARCRHRGGLCRGLTSTRFRILRSFACDWGALQWSHPACRR